MKAGAHDRINVKNNPLNFVDPFGLIGVGLAGGGSATFFGFRFSIHLEARLIHDSNKSWFNISSYSGGLTTSTTYANNYDSNPCNDAQAAGINAEVGIDQLLTNANHISQILGDSEATGFSIGWKRGIDAELAVMQKNGKDLTLSNGTPIFELSAGVPFYGINYGVEAHTGVKGHTSGAQILF